MVAVFLRNQTCVSSGVRDWVAHPYIWAPGAEFGRIAVELSVKPDRLPLYLVQRRTAQFERRPPSGRGRAGLVARARGT